jgi:hypothetical protein
MLSCSIASAFFLASGLFIASMENCLIRSTSFDGSGEYSRMFASSTGFDISCSLNTPISGAMMAQLASVWFGDVGASSMMTSYSPIVLSFTSGTA